MKKTMVNRRFWLGMLVMVLAFGMTVIGCDNDSPPGNGDGGLLTIIDIPSQYNGKYIAGKIDGDDYIGCYNYDPSTGEEYPALISNGRAEVSLWVEDSDGTWKGFNGNDIGTFAEFTTGKDRFFTDGEESDHEFRNLSLRFTNGSATLSWNSGNRKDVIYD